MIQISPIFVSYQSICVRAKSCSCRLDNIGTFLTSRQLQDQRCDEKFEWGSDVYFQFQKWAMPLLNLGMVILHNIQKHYVQRLLKKTYMYPAVFMLFLNCSDRNSLFHFTVYIFEIIV